ncbi:MAG: NADH:ubiquinone reductase (Na(+)-transporting) subunit C [Bacteroidia bacterium]|nr:MAG: NADH:ubiquinone reductase (Na(+)-transporting) subunit C [Bacteroidia bacterium]
MKKDSNVYIFLYSVALVVVVAVLLAVASTALRPAQERNIEMEKRLDILKAIGVDGQVETMQMPRQAAVSELYDRFITERLVVSGDGVVLEGWDAFQLDLRPELARMPGEQQLPVFVAHLDDGSTKYVFPLAGQGLWGPVWGYISLDADMDHIYGVSFGHKGETPGLGAEIVGEWFCGQFKGKAIFSGSSFVSVAVLKGAGASEGMPSAVDGISGGTLTSQGVEQMLMASLSAYRPYIERMRDEKAQPPAPVEVEAEAAEEAQTEESEQAEDATLDASEAQMQTEKEGQSNG